eukprot:g5195.t1
MQNFNYAGIRQFMDIITGNQRLAIPHLTVKKMQSINWKKLKAAGLRGKSHFQITHHTYTPGCVFDKDNTLTRPFSRSLDPEVIDSLDACKEAFGGQSIVLFSNSAGLKQYDPEGHEANQLEQDLGITVLRHLEKKPAGGVRELVEFFGCDADELIMIGDRLLTDVVFGNRNGMFTIYIEPIETETEPFGVRFARSVEDRLWTKWKHEDIQVKPISNSMN